MNVLKFNIEVLNKDSKKPILNAILECLENDQTYVDDSYSVAIKKEWNKLNFETIKLLNSEEYLLGGFEKNGIRIFIFEIRKDGLKNINNLTLDVICYADLPVNKILNDSFKKIQTVFKPHKTKYIEDSKILIYPFDTKQNDIWSAEFKIKADIISPYEFDKKQIIRWTIIGFLTIVLLILYFAVDVTAFKEVTDATGKAEKIPSSDLKSIYLSLSLSGMFYVLLELIIYVIAPFLTNRNQRIIEVKNLSSIVENSVPYEELTKKSSKLTIPKID